MKIFVKEIKVQVMGYLEVNNLITSDQSAYRNQHNTQTALHRVVDDWLYNISDGNLTGVCSFDITKLDMYIPVATAEKAFRLIQTYGNI